MQRVLSIALAFCLALTVSLDANAKRFGGGKSLGSAPSHQTRQAQPATAPNATAAAPNAARPAAAASGASRWLGPLAGIAEFVTPQMLQWLKQERAEIGDAYQSTYIDNLDVQLDGVDDQADKTIATLTFSGVSKTSRFDQGEAFSESWRMERAQGENQPWLVAGIRQN
ncbi:hypothetical protein [Pseudomonas aeruginosa]|uniref:hypothetical protein n=1 Tax=Pseudomonas aeruginosa TaxID=287 RepID=UPI00041EACD3|nr:hypothetical protein [Pseudomonas aeruginosa]